MTPSDWAQLVIAAATCFAAYFAYKSANASKETSEGQLFNQLMSEYASHEMAEALRELLANAALWQPRPGSRPIASIMTGWAQMVASTAGGRDSLDDARRRVSQFYHKATRIIEDGLLTQGRRAEITALSGCRVMYDAVLPLEELLATQLGTQAEGADWIARFRRVFPDPRRPQPVNEV